VFKGPDVSWWCQKNADLFVWSNNSWKRIWVKTPFFTQKTLILLSQRRVKKSSGGGLETHNFCILPPACYCSMSLKLMFLVRLNKFSLILTFCTCCVGYFYIIAMFRLSEHNFVGYILIICTKSVANLKQINCSEQNYHEFQNFEWWLTQKI